MRIPPTVIPHASFDSLIEGITDRWLAHAPTPVPQPVVIPSLPFSDHLQLRIADRFGVCMGLDFLTPQAFIHRAVGPHSETVWSPRPLAWRILPHMAAIAPRLGVSDPQPRDRLALARLLADQFDQYAHFRPEIIRDWAAGRSILDKDAKPQDADDESWQRELWNLLRVGVEAHPAEAFETLRANAAFRKTLRARFPRLFVLGSGTIDPLLIETLDLLADAGGDVELQVVLPSLEFLGDLHSRKRLPSADDDPEAISPEASHPLLASMGRHSIGAFLLLGKLDDQYAHWPEPSPWRDTQSSLLAQLQADIRASAAPSARVVSPADRSISIHSCFGPRREMEVLRDEILRAFTEIDGLRPEDVHIVTPTLEIYAPLVHAVLENGVDPLPVRLTEIPITGGTPALEAALALLQMAHAGQFEASALMELIQLEAVQDAIGISGDDEGVENVRDWIRRCGLTRGISENDRAPGTWTFSRDRLIAARWFGENQEVGYPDGDFALPVADALGGSDDIRQAFIEWHAACESILRGWRILATPREWTDRIANLFGTVIAEDEDGLLGLQRLLAPLAATDCAELVDAGAIRDWLETEGRESGRRTPVSGRIPFGRLKQLQNIPCRVLAIVGMDDSAFPGRNSAPAWDMLRRKPRAWDRNPHIDDRQLFLDAILTPSDRLIITAGTRNIRNGKTEPFSACVDELLRVTAVMGAPRERLVTEHRLQPFAVDYFDGRAARSFNAEFAEVARALAQPSASPFAPFWTGRAPAESSAMPDLTLTQLVEFWANPARGFLRAEGIVVPGEEADDEALDRAPAGIGGLSAWRVKHVIVEGVATSVDPALTMSRLRANRELPPGHLGTAAWEAARRPAESLGLAILRHLGESRRMEFEIPGGPRINGEISFTRNGDRLLAHRVGEFKHADHYLEPWISAVFAACSGHPIPTLLLDDVRAGSPGELPSISHEDAVRSLAALTAGFLQGQTRPLCYAPRTSDACAKAQDKGKDGVAAAFEEWHRKDRDFGGGDGLTNAAHWAWRDRDPFAEPGEWLEWTRRIAAPLRRWGGFP